MPYSTISRTNSKGAWSPGFHFFYATSLLLFYIDTGIRLGLPNSLVGSSYRVFAQFSSRAPVQNCNGQNDPLEDCRLQLETTKNTVYCTEIFKFFI